MTKKTLTLKTDNFSIICCDDTLSVIQIGAASKIVSVKPSRVIRSYNNKSISITTARYKFTKNSKLADPKKIKEFTYNVLSELLPNWKKELDEVQPIFLNAKHEVPYIMSLLQIIRTPAILLLLKEIPKFGKRWFLKGGNEVLPVFNPNATSVKKIFNLTDQQYTFIAKGDFKEYQLKWARQIVLLTGEDFLQITELVKNHFISSDFTVNRIKKYNTVVQLISNHGISKVLAWCNSNKFEVVNFISMRLIWMYMESLGMLNDTMKRPLIRKENINSTESSLRKLYGMYCGSSKGNEIGFLIKTREAAKFLNDKVDNFEFKVIDDKNDLIREGGELHHCVAGYYGQISRGNSTIVTMRKLTQKDKAFLTIEVYIDHSNSDKVTFGRCHGACNRMPTETETKTILKWLRNCNVRAIENPPDNIFKTIKLQKDGTIPVLDAAIEKIQSAIAAVNKL